MNSSNMKYQVMLGQGKIATGNAKAHTHSFFFPKPPTPFDLYGCTKPKLIPTAAVTSMRRKRSLKSRTGNPLHEAGAIPASQGCRKGNSGSAAVRIQG
jgi:hypothetical protein